MNLTPKNIFRGRNSNGSSFRVEEWDFATLSNLELGGQIIMFIFCMALISLTSPLLTILIILGISGRFNYLYILSLMFGTYFLYDCSQGWLSLMSLNLILNESWVNFFVELNIASVFICVMLVLFGKPIYGLIVKPISKYDEDSYYLLPNKEREEIESIVTFNKSMFYFLIAFIFLASFIIGGKFLNENKGWVKYNIEYVSPEAKEEARQDSIKKALGDFKSQEERDNYFKELERKY